jgi:hypothetical protein
VTLFAIGAAALLIFLGCSVSSINIDTVDVGDLETETVTVAREDADTVRAYIRMGAGELKIDNGADGLMEADFTYNVPDWRPEVEYEVSNGEGRLTVRQPNTDDITLDSNIRYEWDLRFAENVPLDLRVECGAGEHDIDLAGLDVTELDVKLGAGDVEIDLSDNESLSRLEFDIGAGSANINLDGPWADDVDVDIQGGVGQTKLRLPSDVGVRVDVTRGIGDIDVSGLYRQGNAYVNDAYDESDVTMEVNIQAGIGRIELEVAR